MKWLPNFFTMLRIALIPLIIITMYWGHGPISHQIAMYMFILASLTDFLDGYIAKVWKMQSDFGKIFDSIADKLLIVSVLVVLVDKDQAPLIPALAIIWREFLVAGMREYLAEIHVGLPVSELARIKAAVQMIALVFLIIGNEGYGMTWVNTAGLIALWFATILTLITGYAYLRASLKHM